MIVKYSLLQNRVVMRIGGEGASTFINPVSVETYDGCLYVCCKNARKIRRVRLSDFTVEEYKEFDEPVFKYLRVGKHEFAVLESGVYML